MTTDKKQGIKNYILETLTRFTSVLPISLAASLFMGLNLLHGTGTALLASVFFKKTSAAKIMPAYAAFLVIMFASDTFGIATASLAAFVCGILSLIFYFLPKQFEIRDNPVTAGLMLATALTVTVLLTTHYFGIGASGNNVKEMVASYLSLGFHPNWRGVLYGTIVMVIMITFPRKFKEFSKTIKAPFVALTVTLILNFFLNPSYMKTAVTEPDKFQNNSIFENNYISSNEISFFFGNDIDVFTAIVCGISLFFICNFALSKTDAEIKDKRFSSLLNLLFGSQFVMVMPYGTKIKRSFTEGLGSAVLCTVVLLGLFKRIPVHSLAVVMIVGAWESVEWSKIKTAFSSPVSVICFALSVASTLYFGYVYGILISAVLYVIYHFYNARRSKVSEISG